MFCVLCVVCVWSWARQTERVCVYVSALLTVLVLRESEKVCFVCCIGVSVDTERVCMFVCC